MSSGLGSQLLFRFDPSADRRLERVLDASVTDIRARATRGVSPFSRLFSHGRRESRLRMFLKRLPHPDATDSPYAGDLVVELDAASRVTTRWHTWAAGSSET